jgi:hypothetical protein
MGTYDEGDDMFLNAGKPSNISLMTRTEVAHELRIDPGVKVDTQGEKTTEKPSRSTSSLFPVPTDAAQDDDESYTSEASEKEPQEEYNEFDEEVDDNSSDDCLPPVVDLPDLHDRQNFFLHLRLYIMADKYDVPALRLLARDRFYRAAETSWRVAKSFPAVIDELYSCTLPTEIAMREIVCRLVGTDIRGDGQRERMNEVMRKHGDFAVGVLNYMLEAEREW